MSAPFPTHATPSAPPPVFTVERIESLRWHTPSLACFGTTRPAPFHFTAGHYARLGLGEDEAIVWRPYSIASAPDAPRLDFQITLVPGGEFCTLFSRCGAGSPVRVDRRSFGFLTLSQLARGGTLWLIATGTGLAPFLSILGDSATWARHERVVLVHSVRHAAELMPEAIDAAIAPGQPLRAFQSLSIVTRERAPGCLHERVGALLRSGELEARAGGRIDAERARVMLCGNPEMIRDLRSEMRERGLAAARRGVPGQLAAEGYW
jgi:ferredoxin--NADP+ reductase